MIYFYLDKYALNTLPYFGSLLVIGVWPPSNLGWALPPDLDNWPLWPRADVFLI